MHNAQKIVCAIGVLPSLALLLQCIFVLETDRDRKHLAYHISGEWGLRFLYFTLAMTPLYHLSKVSKFILVRQTLGLLSFYYVLIHIFTYLRYTLKDRSINGLLDHINTRPYLIYGIIAFSLMVPLAITSLNYFKEKMGFKNWKMLHRLVYIIVMSAAYHLYVRHWDRINRGKSGVEGATNAPFIVAGLLGYRIIRYIWYSLQKKKNSNKLTEEGTRQQTSKKVK